MTRQVLILGAGLAGLAAAGPLAARGFHVRLVESRNRTGGRASSFTDATTGQLIDACQHVSMGCCTNFAHFCAQAGIAHLVAPQRRLYFMTPDGRVSSFGADPLPAPLHLTRSFLTAHYLTFAEKTAIARGLAALRFTSSEDDRPFRDWLIQHRQPPRTVDRFWGLVLVSALNEEADRIGLKYARKVFVDGFLKHPRGFQVEVPTVPLGQLYGAELDAWLARNRITLSLNQAVRRIEVRDQRVACIELRSGEQVSPDWVISALPFQRLLELLPEVVIEQHACFANLRHLQTSPITSVHLWYDRPICRWPHLVLIDGLGQWLFQRGETAPGEHYIQIVVSASRRFRGLGHEEVQRRIVAELRSLLGHSAQLLRARVVTEHQATFSVVPGVDRWRPSQKTPIANLFLAGDWTATGWPATMESAVRSGYLAAEELLAQTGHPVRLLQPDL